MITGFKLIGTSLIHTVERHTRELADYRKLTALQVSPIGKTIIHNTEVPDDKVIGFHGGCGTKWLEQAKKVESTATAGGLYVGCTFVAASYAKDQKEPVIIKLAADIQADRDHTSGIGAHFHVPQGTPVLIKSVHQINPEYLEHLSIITGLERPSLWKALKSDPALRSFITLESDDKKTG